MAGYQVQNRWGGSSAPWHNASTWILGTRKDQYPVEVKIESEDHGATLSGTMTYQGEGPISLRASQQFGNVYKSEVQWGGDKAPWHDEGLWVIGGRDAQRCIMLNVKSSDNGKTMHGTMKYSGEGEIGFKGESVPMYRVQNQWGGKSAEWHDGGVWILSGRSNQLVKKLELQADDYGGSHLQGTMTYDGEGPIGFNGQLSMDDVYTVENRWGGDSAPWHRGGDMILGARENQKIVKLIASSSDGKMLSGEMTYCGEGPIGFKAELLTT